MAGTDDASRQRPDQLLVVGLGASAGGIAALKRFFAQVTPNRNTAYVVILHLSPDRDSQLAEILQLTAPLPVRQVTDRTPVQPDHVYVIPPNKSLAIMDDTLVLSDFTLAEQRRSPVDLFFRTLAEAHGSHAACVILSGTGANGSAGLKLVKEHGGLAVVQDPNQAEYADMPSNAIATGLVDLVLPVEEMAPKIDEYHRHLRQGGDRPVESVEGTDDAAALRDILMLLKARTGNDFANYKPGTLLRRINRRATIAGLPTLGSYGRFIREQPNEALTLMRDLLISVTHFFRDVDAFDLLRQRLIPQLFDTKGPDDTVRIWVAACATGEEAYSIAMLVCEHLDGRLDKPSVQVFATDLDERAIGKARDGFYGDAEIADISELRLSRFFHRERAGYRIRRELRELILFAHHNLIRDPPFSHLDLISCRNLLIYLNRTAQDRVMETFHFALRPGGFLVLGPSESLEGSDDLFLTIDRACHLYQSRAVRGRPLLPDPLEPMLLRSQVRQSETPPVERFAPFDAHHRLLEEYAPPSIIVTPDHSIVHISSRAGQYLQMSAGEPSRDVIKLVRPELRGDLRTALFQSAKQRNSVEVPDLSVTVDGNESRITLIVRPVVSEDDPARGFFLILFADRAGADDSRREVRPLDPSEEPVAQRLEEDLTRLRVQLKTTIEQYEAQVEEAQAAAEEQQATNEELRCSAEELETSKEELQSANEELTTVNQELKVKIEELRLSNSDFQNLMNSTDMATVFLDRSLRVKLTTPRAREVFNLQASDVGRPLSDITTRLRHDLLEQDMREVLDALQSIDREVQTLDGRWYQMRIRPYRTVDDRIDGLVLMFQDISDRRRAESTVIRTEERLRLLIEGATDYAIFTMTEDGQIDFWNRGADRLFGYSSEDIIGRPYEVLFTPEDRATGLPAAELRQARQEGRALDERHYARRDGTLFLASGVTTRLGDGLGLGFAKIARDLTSQQRSEQAVRDAHAALEPRVADRTRELNTEIKSHEAAQRHVVNLLRKLVTAQEDERGRIARNLHDQLGQRLTALRLSLERLQGRDNERSIDDGDVVRALSIVEAIDSEVGFLARELRPALLDHLGLNVALPQYVAGWSEHYGVEVKYQGDGFQPGMISQDAEIAFYRIAQEALTNVAKHAHASRVDVLLEIRSDSVVLVIEDNGVGFDPEATTSTDGGIGLLGMRERAALIGAAFQLESGVGEGTSIYIRQAIGAETPAVSP